GGYLEGVGVSLEHSAAPVCIDVTDKVTRPGPSCHNHHVVLEHGHIVPGVLAATSEVQHPFKASRGVHLDKISPVEASSLPVVDLSFKVAGSGAPSDEGVAAAVDGDVPTIINRRTAEESYPFNRSA